MKLVFLIFEDSSKISAIAMYMLATVVHFLIDWQLLLKPQLRAQCIARTSVTIVKRNLISFESPLISYTVAVVSTVSLLFCFD